MGLTYADIELINADDEALIHPQRQELTEDRVS